MVRWRQRDVKLRFFVVAGFVVFFVLFGWLCWSLPDFPIGIGFGSQSIDVNRSIVSQSLSSSISHGSSSIPSSFMFQSRLSEEDAKSVLDRLSERGMKDSELTFAQRLLRRWFSPLSSSSSSSSSSSTSTPSPTPQKPPPLSSSLSSSSSSPSSPSLPSSSLLNTDTRPLPIHHLHAGDKREFCPDNFVPLENRMTPSVVEKRQAIVDAFLHCWDAYKKHAWGLDEIQPVTGTATLNAWGGMGATLIDSLDTLWLMGLRQEFDRAREWVRDKFDPVVDWNGSVFEVTIRYIGGLLSAFELSGDRMFIDKAVLVARQLAPVFRTSSGLAKTTVNMRTGRSFNPSWNGQKTVLSEFGSLGPEWRALSHLTQNSSYANTVDHIFWMMSNFSAETNSALLPTFWDDNTGRPTNSHITYGARGDSYYEYLLKMWIQSGKTDARSKALYDQAIQETQDRLVQVAPKSQLTWIAELDGGIVVKKMDELVCFVPGMLALDGNDHHLSLATSLARTCWQFFNRTRTGLAPEIASFASGDFACKEGAFHNLLRPETVESLFYLWRRTGCQQYRDWSWMIFENWNRYARVDFGFSGIRNVEEVPPHHDNRMESFFLAETLKYLFLTFSDDSAMDFTKYFFNTEAHIMRIFSAVG